MRLVGALSDGKPGSARLPEPGPTESSGGSEVDINLCFKVGSLIRISRKHKLHGDTRVDR